MLIVTYWSTASFKITECWKRPHEITVKMLFRKLCSKWKHGLASIKSHERRFKDIVFQNHPLESQVQRVAICRWNHKLRGSPQIYMYKELLSFSFPKLKWLSYFTQWEYNLDINDIICVMFHSPNQNQNVLHNKLLRIFWCSCFYWSYSYAHAHTLK